jgi:hypothetical protein
VSYDTNNKVLLANEQVGKAHWRGPVMTDAGLIVGYCGSAAWLAVVLVLVVLVDQRHAIR